MNAQQLILLLSAFPPKIDVKLSFGRMGSVVHVANDFEVREREYGNNVVLMIEAV